MSCSSRKPEIVNNEDYAQFCQKAQAYFNADPQSQWYGGYVAHEWMHLRHILEALPISINQRHILELGCNVGASSIVTASLGGRVTGTDINPYFTEVAGHHVAAYGLEDKVTLETIEATGYLPFPDQSFDMIIANSVLEYVDSNILPLVLSELDRVLMPEGLILIQGTSNRLALREVHSGRLFVNYLPKFFDKIFGKSFQRGVSPFTLKKAFADYENLELQDKSKSYLKIRKKFGWSDKLISIFQIAARILAPFGLTPSLFTPNITMTLKKIKK